MGPNYCFLLLHCPCRLEHPQRRQDFWILGPSEPGSRQTSMQFPPSQSSPSHSSSKTHQFSLDRSLPLWVQTGLPALLLPAKKKKKKDTQVTVSPEASGRPCTEYGVLHSRFNQSIQNHKTLKISITNLMGRRRWGHEGHHGVQQPLPPSSRYTIRSKDFKNWVFQGRIWQHLCAENTEEKVPKRFLLAFSGQTQTAL